MHCKYTIIFLNGDYNYEISLSVTYLHVSRSFIQNLCKIQETDEKIHICYRFHPSLRANERASQKIKLLYKFIY